MRKNRIGKQERQQQYTILALDDDRIMTETLQSYFENSGFRVDIENDPYAAIERVRRGQYDILLLDFLMDPICGDEVVAQIRAFNQELFIILLTGHKSMAPPIRTIRELDIQGYYEKSDRFDQLELLVESCVKSIDQMRTIRKYRDGLQDILDSTPLLYQLQPLSSLLQVVLDQIRRMLPDASACVYLGGVPSMEIPPVYQGIGRYESNLCLAREWYLKLADQEYVPAQRNMAERQLVLPLYNEHHQIEGIFLLDLPDGFPEHGLTLLEVYAKQVAAAISNITLHLLVNQKNEALNQAYAKLRDNYLEVIQAIRALVDAKDIYTRGHSDRVSYFADLVAQALGKDEAYRERIRVAGLFHDIGKIGTADQLLNKQSRLTAEEYEEIQLHPQRGSEILSAVSTFRPIAPIVECHHERFDGRGYPNGLSGEDIPEESRIIGVVDAFDAMTSDRLYRSSIGIERAKEELKNGRGTQFDPRIVDVFLTILHEYDRVQEKIAWTYATIPQDSSSPQLP